MTDITEEAIGFVAPSRREAVVLSGPRVAAASPFDVTALAVGAVTDALTALRDLHGWRNDHRMPANVHVDSARAVAAFRAEALFEPRGWALPSPWDPLSAVFGTNDGWIRLHANYAAHRNAIERVLGATTPERAASAARGWSAVALEDAVVAAGGAAAALRTRDAWQTTGLVPHAVVETSLGAPATALMPPSRSGLPLTGVRVLDITRVIAGPTATRLLGAYGADVLRIDPPGFAEVPALLPESTRAKRRATVDLRTAEGHDALTTLVTQADVVVCGLRADALARLGLDDERMRALNPGVILAHVNAYGWGTAWQNRRGFDSLVQFATGIAAATAKEDGTPGALPMQALDHATGWLLAGEVVRAVTERARTGRPATIHASLAGTAAQLMTLPGTLAGAPPFVADGTRDREARSTSWGPAWGVGEAGSIDGIIPTGAPIAGPLGAHAPVWLPRSGR